MDEYCDDAKLVGDTQPGAVMALPKLQNHALENQRGLRLYYRWRTYVSTLTRSRFRKNQSW